MCVRPTFCHPGGPITLRRRAFSLVELLVVISILGILVGLTFTALSGSSSAGENLKSRNNLRQIYTWMESYASNHQDRIVPSQFDYLDENGDEVGSVGSRLGYSSGPGGSAEWVETKNLLGGTGGDPRSNFISQGTWADIIWVDSNLGSDVGLADFDLVNPVDGSTVGGDDSTKVSYRYQAPNRHIYDINRRFNRNPLRSAAVNTFDFPMVGGGAVSQTDLELLGQSGDSGPLGLPKPFGAGAWEKDYPGFFAANSFFDGRSQRDISGVDTDADIDRSVSTGQLRNPTRSMYLVDSFAGLTIGGGPTDEEATFDAFLSQEVGQVGVIGDGLGGIGTGDRTQEVDYRYGGGDACLMLFLDGHTELVSRFGNLTELQGGNGLPGRGIRVTDLDKRKSEVNLENSDP